MPDEPQHHLLGTSLTDEQRIHVPTSLPVRRKDPVTVEEIREQGLAGSGWEHFEDRERHIAEELRDRGVTVVSVRKSAGRTPDALLDDVTVEFKTPRRERADRWPAASETPATSRDASSSMAGR